MLQETSQNELPQLLTVAEFAERLRISVWTARAWAYSGRITSVKIGARLQVPVGEVTRVIREGTRPRIEARRESRPRCRAAQSEAK